jgi:hypothetical protein
MFSEYIYAALSKATYEIIDDPEPFYGEVPELRGVWASGKTLEVPRKSERRYRRLDSLEIKAGVAYTTDIEARKIFIITHSCTNL